MYFNKWMTYYVQVWKRWNTLFGSSLCPCKEQTALGYFKLISTKISTRWQYRVIFPVQNQLFSSVLRFVTKSVMVLNHKHISVQGKEWMWESDHLISLVISPLNNCWNGFYFDKQSRKQRFDTYMFSEQHLCTYCLQNSPKIEAHGGVYGVGVFWTLHSSSTTRTWEKTWRWTRLCREKHSCSSIWPLHGHTWDYLYRSSSSEWNHPTSTNKHNLTVRKRVIKRGEENLWEHHDACIAHFVDA